MFKYSVFTPSARWARKDIVVPFVRCLRRRRTQPFAYYTNMVQQIKGTGPG